MAMFFSSHFGDLLNIVYMLAKILFSPRRAHQKAQGLRSESNWIKENPLAARCEPSALKGCILEILYCDPKGKGAFLHILFTEGRGVRSCWAVSKPKGPRGGSGSGHFQTTSGENFRGDFQPQGSKINLCPPENNQPHPRLAHFGVQRSKTPNFPVSQDPRPSKIKGPNSIFPSFPRF